MTRNDEQAKASAWALAFFLVASRNRCSAPRLRAACSASPTTKPFNALVLQDLWSADPAHEHQDEQVLVDFSVHNWDAANPIQLTGESETNVQQGTGDSLRANTYGWDFYKLLVVPSSTRLFFARVGGDGGISALTRCDELRKTLVGLVDWYGPALLRPHDELGAVITSSSKADRASSIVLWLDRGRLRHERVSAQCGLDLQAPPAP